MTFKEAARNPYCLIYAHPSTIESLEQSHPGITQFIHPFQPTEPGQVFALDIRDFGLTRTQGRDHAQLQQGSHRRPSMP